MFKKVLISYRIVVVVHVKWIARKDASRLFEIQKKYGIPYGTTN